MPGFQRPGVVKRPVAGTGDENKTLSAKFTPGRRYRMAGEQPRRRQEEPRQEEKQSEKNAADIQLQREDKYDQRQSTRRGLTKGFKKNDRRASGFHAMRNVEPVTEGDKCNYRKTQEQRLYVSEKVKVEIEWKPLAQEVGRFERRGGEKRIQKSKYDAGFALLAAEHRLQITT